MAPIGMFPGRFPSKECIFLTDTDDEGQNQESYQLRRLWILSKVAVTFPHWWSTKFSCGYTLYAHPHARIRSMEIGDVRMFLLGVACRSDGRQLFDGLEGFASTIGDPGAVRSLDHLVGCYVLLVDHPESGISLFTDPASLMNVFRRVDEYASSPALFSGVQPDLEVAAVFTLNATDAWMPGSRTSFAGVRAMPANHRIDTSSGNITRFWPREPFSRVDTDEATRRGSELLRECAASMVHDHRVLLSLTGGVDSRVMLAAFRDHKDLIETFSIDVLDRRERTLIDEIVRLTGIRHRYLTLQPTTDHVMALYDGMTLGQSLGSRRTIAGTCWQLRDTDAVHVSGNLVQSQKRFIGPMEIHLGRRHID